MDGRAGASCRALAGNSGAGHEVGTLMQACSCHHLAVPCFGKPLRNGSHGPSWHVRRTDAAAPPVQLPLQLGSSQRAVAARLQATAEAAEAAPAAEPGEEFYDASEAPLAPLEEDQGPGRQLGCLVVCSLGLCCLVFQRGQQVRVPGSVGLRLARTCLLSRMRCYACCAPPSLAFVLHKAGSALRCALPPGAHLRRHAVL